MFMKTFMVCNIINFFQSLYLGCSIFFLTMSIVFSLAIASVFLLGQNSVSSWFNLSFSVLRCPFARWTPSQSTSQCSSNGCKCWTAHSKYNLLVLTRTARTVLSGPRNTSVIKPNIPFPLFWSLLRTITTSLTFDIDIRSLVFMLWRSDLSYCFLHLSHAASLHFRIYLNLLRKFLFSISIFLSGKMKF